MESGGWKERNDEPDSPKPDGKSITHVSLSCTFKHYYTHSLMPHPLYRGARGIVVCE